MEKERPQKKQQESVPQSTMRNLGLYDWMQALVCAVLVVVLVFTFFIRLVRVDGPSMRQTLQDGDRLAVLNTVFCGEYQPGEIVIVRKGTFNRGAPIVKRVIATEGQTVDIDFSTGTLTIDGAVQQEPYINDLTYLQEGTEFPLTVPQGCIFVLGDNRNNSDDSRDPALGAVDTRYVIGRAVFLVFPGVSELTRTREASRIGTF